MSYAIKWTTRLQVPSGPDLSISRAMSVEAYDSIQVTVNGTAAVSGADTDKEVAVQPSGPGQVKFLAITSDRFGEGLTFKVNATDSPVIKLDQPQVYSGEGAVGLLNPDPATPAAPATLFFSNTMAENASIHVLVGRNAVVTSGSG